MYSWWFVVGVVLCCGLGVLYMVGTTPRLTTQGAIMLRQKGDESLTGQLESLSMLGMRLRSTSTVRSICTVEVWILLR